MATPTESVTTVSGKRCTRSRARTATSIATSAPPKVTSAQAAPATSQVQSSAVVEASSSPPPPPSSTQVQVPAIVSSNVAAASSAIGTDSPVSTSTPEPSALAKVPNSPPVAQAPPLGPPVIATSTAGVVSTAAEIPVVSAAVTAVPSTTSTSTSSDSIDTIAIPTSSTILISSATAAPIVSSLSSVNAERPIPSAVPSETSSNNPSSSDTPKHQSQQPQSTQSASLSGDPAGIISPQEGSGDGSALALSRTGGNIGGIVGGVVGGLLGLILISGLLFLCLRKRKSREPFEKWRQRMSEKEEESSGFSAKVRGIPVAIGIFYAKIRGNKAGPAQNAYRRQSVHSSASSIYSTQLNHPRSRSISEPPSTLRQQLRDAGGRMPSLKKSRTLLRKKQDSFVVGPKSPFIGILGDPVANNSKGVDNPFADPYPGPLQPPKNLFVLNPDPKSSQNSPNLQKDNLDDLRFQQHAPTVPLPATVSDRGSLASIMARLDNDDGSGTPEWLRDNHKRSKSASTALASHPPSTLYSPSIYASADNPFVDPTDVPPIPPQSLPPNPPKKPANAYGGLISFVPATDHDFRASNTSFYFGEPGPSRPTTRMFAAPPRRPGRQSDPFDLDRPEVLGFGAVGGRRDVRGSTVTRQNSRRSSTTLNVDDSPFARASAVIGSLKNSIAKK